MSNFALNSSSTESGIILLLSRLVPIIRGKYDTPRWKADNKIPLELLDAIEENVLSGNDLPLQDALFQTQSKRHLSSTFAYHAQVSARTVFFTCAEANGTPQLGCDTRILRLTAPACGSVPFCQGIPRRSTS